MLLALILIRKIIFILKFKRYLRRGRLKWDDNIKMNLKQDVRL